MRSSMHWPTGNSQLMLHCNIVLAHAAKQPLFCEFSVKTCTCNSHRLNCERTCPKLHLKCVRASGKCHVCYAFMTHLQGCAALGKKRVNKNNTLIDSLRLWQKRAASGSPAPRHGGHVPSARSFAVYTGAIPANASGARRFGVSRVHPDQPSSFSMAEECRINWQLRIILTI